MVRVANWHRATTRPARGAGGVWGLGSSESAHGVVRWSGVWSGTAALCRLISRLTPSSHCHMNTPRR
jgi:hypothetical protein